MGRIMAIDCGRRRSGIAVTDILQLVPGGLPTVSTCDLPEFVKDYCQHEPVDRILIGHPKNLKGEDSESMRYIRPVINRLRKLLPGIVIEEVDERFTTTQAHRDMITAGFKKSDRQRKGLADEMAAVLILNLWLESR